MTSVDAIFAVPVGFGYDRFNFDLRLLSRPAFGSSIFDGAVARGAPTERPRGGQPRGRAW